MFDKFTSVSVCDYADALPRQQFIDYRVRSLWTPVPRIAGPAFTVKCEPGDHLMFHAAVYRASPGDIIVAQGDDMFALAGGNVCAIAQERGIAGFVIDGVIRDVGEVRQMAFPVFARGVCPKPGAKKKLSPLNEPVHCGGVKVNPGDIIVADEEGIAVIPLTEAAEVLQIAQARAGQDSNMTLSQWRENHLEKLEFILTKLGFEE
ncbi:RraA family protein [Aestuariibacter sp. A3R04]|uniref:RraA family protein n=1 Tax=Aestuariibacter sp. A3R04 TaxID=2841571 RepID=UPI001C084914|nr:RraA family protein [Aestuariibacter sp. A3R04]MBU3023559.1 RraA family protein [Aestuariibacter sp. A3R04]